MRPMERRDFCWLVGLGLVVMACAPVSLVDPADAPAALPAGCPAASPPETLSGRLGPLEFVVSIPHEVEFALPGWRSATEVWRELIDGAETSIDLGQFYAESAPGSALEPIIEALAAAAARGVAVRFLTERSFYGRYPETVDRLMAVPGVAVRTLATAELMGGVLHAKYFVVDGETAFVGSQNFDWRALEHNFELGLVIRVPLIAATYAGIFEADWALAGGYGPFAALDWAPMEDTVPASVPVATAEGRLLVRPVMSPGGFLFEKSTWDLPALLEMIDGAERTVRVQVMTYSRTGHGGETDPRLDEALRRAAGRGVDVKLLVANWNKRGSRLGRPPRARTRERRKDWLSGGAGAHERVHPVRAGGAREVSGRGREPRLARDEQLEPRLLPLLAQRGARRRRQPVRPPAHPGLRSVLAGALLRAGRSQSPFGSPLDPPRPVRRPKFLAQRRRAAEGSLSKSFTRRVIPAAVASSPYRSKSRILHSLRLCVSAREFFVLFVLFVGYFSTDEFFRRDIPLEDQCFRAATVLELGAGEGRYLPLILDRRPARVFAVDVSDKCFELYERHAASGRVEVIQADVKALPFRRAAFDVVICSRVLHHVPDMAARYADVVRLLQPGGIFASVIYGKHWAMDIVKACAAMASSRLSPEATLFACLPLSAAAYALIHGLYRPAARRWPALPLPLKDGMLYWAEFSFPWLWQKVVADIVFSAHATQYTSEAELKRLLADLPVASADYELDFGAMWKILLRRGTPRRDLD
jgi:2-polyprenyl-3-methyl-5-hydroxy-6-metoxy-1,4-benzoquinol methylase